MSLEFLNPQYLTEAFDILDARGSDVKIVAGMTHLLRFYPDFPVHVPTPAKAVLHIGNLSPLSECREENSRYVMGATTTLASLAKDSYLARYAPAVIDAALASSTPQIRNRRTLGGEIGWGSFHSAMIVTLMALKAKVRLRFAADPKQKGAQGREESWEISDFYLEGDIQRTQPDGKTQEMRKARSMSEHLIMKVTIPEESFHGSGSFSFYRGLKPKISTENSGVVLAVHGVANNGMIHSATMVASGLWMRTCEAKLPLEGVRMNDNYIFEKLYTFCDRYSFDKYLRAEDGPSASQLGLILFGLLKEGFSGLLGRS